MAARSSMSSLITLVRQMIADPSATQFQDQDVQDRLDASRDDIRYEVLQLAPSIVNTASTNNQASTIFADYYSKYQWWEADVVLQGQGPTGAPWKVLTPVASDYITGYWQFETNVFTSGTVPGQLPPVFATGKIYDPYAAAADLLEFWAATQAMRFDFTSDGQSFKRSQNMPALLKLAATYRQRSKPRVVKMVRGDVAIPINPRNLRLLEDGDVVRE
jgi:hypothetical protein